MSSLTGDDPRRVKLAKHSALMKTQSAGWPAMYRQELNKFDATRTIDIRQMRNGCLVRVAGWVIVRQRPGTAKGFMFLTLEDETGVANVIVTPRLFDKYRHALVDHPFLLIEGRLQNQDNVVSVKAKRVRPLSFTVAAAPSHDFH